MGKATRTRANGTSHRDALMDTAAAIGMPAAQRERGRITLVDASIETGHRRSASQTVRKLTRVELLARAGVLERHEVQACEWYAENTALAWDTPVAAVAYDRNGGRGTRGFAPDYQMARTKKIAMARADYREARAMLGDAIATTFEAIVCRNEALGPVAAAMSPTLGRTQAGLRLRALLKFTANKLMEGFGRAMGWAAPVPIAPTTAARPPATTPAPAPADPDAPPSSLTLAIVEAVTVAHALGERPSALWLARACHEQLCREAGTAIEAIGDLPIVIREGWRWGYVVAAASAPADDGGPPTPPPLGPPGGGDRMRGS